MIYQSFLNGVPIAIANADELNLSWQAEPNSPNTVLSFLNTIDLRASNDNADGYRVFEQFVAQFGIHNPIPFSHFDTYSGIELFNGFALPYGESSFYNLNKKQAVLQLWENNFDSILESLNLRSINFQTSDFEYINCVLADESRDELYSVMSVISLALVVSDFIDTLGDLLMALDLNPLDPGDAIRAYILLALRATLLVVALINIIDALIPKTRIYRCIKVHTVLQTAFAQLGYNYSSSITSSHPFNRLYILSETTDGGGETKRQAQNNPLPKYSLLQLCNGLSQMFNAKLKVYNSIVRFERVDFFWQMQNPDNPNANSLVTLDLQDNGTIQYNFKELCASLKISFQKDGAEINTHQKNPQNSIVVTYDVKPAFRRQPNLVGLQGEKVIDIPFSRAIRKGSQSDFEAVIRDIYNVVREIIGGLTLGLAQLPKYPNTNGYMKISSYSVGIDKLFLMQDEKVATNNDVFVNAEHLYNRYHRITSVMERGQWVTHKVDELSTTRANFVRNLKAWNVARDYNNTPIIVTKYEEDLTRRTYQIEYRREQVFLSPEKVQEKVMPD